MNNVLSALKFLDCAGMSHAEWIRVGMALKKEGYDCSVWDAWSAADPARYHPGECARRWASFQGSGNDVTGASIVKMAQERGWTLGADGVMGWEDALTDDRTVEKKCPRWSS